jgi:hypothetical protein
MGIQRDASVAGERAFKDSSGNESPAISFLPVQDFGNVYKLASLCVMAAQFRPVVVNALARRGELTAVWLIAFISGLLLRQKTCFFGRLEKIPVPPVRKKRTSGEGLSPK